MYVYDDIDRGRQKPLQTIRFALLIDDKLMAISLSSLVLLFYFET